MTTPLYTCIHFYQAISNNCILINFDLFQEFTNKRDADDAVHDLNGNDFLGEKYVNTLISGFSNFYILQKKQLVFSEVYCDCAFYFCY